MAAPEGETLAWPMDTSITCRVAAQPELIFALAVRVEDWPRLLPHYRWVRILEQHGRTERLVEMAARRDLAGHLRIPLYWRSIQHFDQERHIVAFEHVAGISKGMRATWSIIPDPTARCVSVVTIRHIFSPGWPVPPSLVRRIVGDYFVDAVAGRTLRILGKLAEAEAEANRQSLALS